MINGQENKEGGNHRQVWNQIRFVHQKNSQEVLVAAKGQVCLPCLRKSIILFIQSQVRRSASGIWKCQGCKVTFAGGAYEFATSVATTAKVTMNRLKKLKEELNNDKGEEEKKEAAKTEKKGEKKEKKAKAAKA